MNAPDSIEDKIGSRISLLHSAQSYKKAGHSAFEWEELARRHCRDAVQAIGDKELDHLIAFVWKIRVR